MPKFFSSRKFMVQLILVFLIFTLGTTTSLGLPFVWLLNRQTNNQLFALLDQTKQTTIALFDNKTNQLQNLAELIVERPTLNQLVSEENNSESLKVYLDDFLQNTGVDIILICQGDRALSMAGTDVRMELCAMSFRTHFLKVEDLVWLSAFSTLPDAGTEGTTVLVGARIESMLNEFSRQSGLEYLLYDQQKLLVSNVLDGDAFSLIQISSPPAHYQKIALRENNPGHYSHMAAFIELPENEPFHLVGLLNIETFMELNNQLRILILVAYVSISLLGALIAIVISRRISRPLSQLAIEAASLREGDLATPLSATSKIWEIDQLTNALEDARVGLKHSLDHLRKEKIWIENLLDSIVEGLLTIDEKFRVTYASEGIERIIGVNVYHLLGKPIDDFLISASGEDPFSMQIPNANQSRRIPVVLNTREVLLAVSSSEVIPPIAGNATRALVIRDVTDEERIHRLLGEFMANITHEFRTPLTALSVSVELMMDQLPSLSTPEIETLLQALNIGIIDLQSLIDNLIETASIEAGRFKVNPQPVELSSIIKDAIKTIQPIAKKYGLSIILPNKEQGLTVIADQRRTCQALINLLSNAIKHSPEGGNIRLSTLILENEIVVEVSDEGEGVSPERLSQLFNRFVSPAPGDHDAKFGLGLGLSVFKAIIEAQHGKVGFKESDRGGALFWFTLRRVKEA